jgi:mono/diheme cytochrome c family protein
MNWARTESRSLPATIVILAALGAGPAVAAGDADEHEAAALRAMVEADWSAQEQRGGRKPSDEQAIRDCLSRVERLSADMDVSFGTAGKQSVAHERTSLDKLRQEAEQVASLDEAARWALYRRIRWMGRELMLKNPLWAGRPILFTKQRRFICQMLHEYIGYYYNYGDLAGGGVYVLEEPGRSLRVRDLVAGRLPRGAYTTPMLSYDGRTIYFAFAAVDAGPRPFSPQGHAVGMLPADRVPAAYNYYGPNRACFHIYAMDADGQNLRQLTDGGEDDFDPCPLPDGRVAFLSSRRGGFCRCDNDFEPIPTCTLHRMQADGQGVETLSVHETNEWHPSVLADGRIVYCRWDYVDRSAAHFHGLWACNPDGSNPVILFGNYTQQVSACFQPRAIPGSRKIVFVAGAHHAVVGGSLAIFDPARARLDAQTGEDRFESIERLTPEVCFPEAPDGWPKSFFFSPWPLSEDYFLTAFSFEPLPGWGSHVREDSKTGIYYLDRFGNLELLYRDPQISAMHPMPLTPRPMPPAIPSEPDPALGDEGEFVLADVHWSLLGLPAERPIRQLRVFQVLPKETTHIANRPRIGYANAESARMLLGTVPVEPDGSAYFRAPAGKPLYFQAVDAAGRAVQGMRSVTYLQPGERRGCVGCHARPGTAPPRRALLATQRPPSVITSGPDGTRPLSYARLVQPVLDRHCVRCHGGQTAGKPPLLTDEPTDVFSRSYESLRPFVRWHEWGGQSISQIVTRPGHQSADESRLWQVLADRDHATEVQLTAEDHERIRTWLDANAPFYGTYREAERQAQRAGQVVPPPRLQ